MAIERDVAALAEEIMHYRDLEARLDEIFGGAMRLSMVVEELENTLVDPDSTHPVNAKILTHEEAKMWEEYKELGTVEEIKEKMKCEK